jgi:hypothetical protein
LKQRHEIQWRMRFQAVWHGWLYVREGDIDNGGKFQIRHVMIRNDRILWWKSLADIEQHPSEPCGWLYLNESSCLVQATKKEEHGAIPYTLPFCVLGMLDVKLPSGAGDFEVCKEDATSNRQRLDSDALPLSIPMQSRKVFLARTLQEKNTVIECLNTVFNKLRER